MKDEAIYVYHGANMSVKKPSLAFGRDDADFGCGFYVSTKLEMAQKWACRKKNPIITQYKLDLRNLEVYRFGQDAEWLKFVVDNRKLKALTSDMGKYDLFIGATADDKLFATIEQYESGFISEATAVEVINFMKIGTQICLRTENALQNLQYVTDIHLSLEQVTEIRKQNAKDREAAGILTSEIIKRAVSQDLNAKKESASLRNDVRPSVFAEVEKIKVQQKEEQSQHTEKAPPKRTKNNDIDL